MSRVVGYFDTATMLSQLGLQAHITPADIEGVVEFGSASVETGRDTAPGAFTVTWIEIDDEHHFDLVEATTAIVMEQVGNDDYLGSCFADRRPTQLHLLRVDRHARRAGRARGDAHTRAMKLTQSGGLGDDARGVTSMWTPTSSTASSTPSGGSTGLSTLGGQWL